MTNKAHMALLSHLSGQIRGTKTTVKNSTAPTVALRPSIHPRGLLQWQAAEFDREVSQAVGEQSPRPWSDRHISRGELAINEVCRALDWKSG